MWGKYSFDIILTYGRVERHYPPPHKGQYAYSIIRASRLAAVNAAHVCFFYRDHWFCESTTSMFHFPVLGPLLPLHKKTGSTTYSVHFRKTDKVGWTKLSTFQNGSRWIRSPVLSAAAQSPRSLSYPLLTRSRVPDVGKQINFDLYVSGLSGSRV